MSLYQTACQSVHWLIHDLLLREFSAEQELSGHPSHICIHHKVAQGLHEGELVLHSQFRKIELIPIEENPKMWDFLSVCCEEIKKLRNTVE